MIRWRKIMVLSILIVFGGLILLDTGFKKLPMISLPKGAQHNNFGELPVVEAWDDGDFYEKDGEEEIVRQKKIRETQLRLESEYRGCLDKITQACGQGSNDKYVYRYYSYSPRAFRERNPEYKHRPKEDKCRSRASEKCYVALEKKAKRAGYLFYSTTGSFYFQAHGDQSDQELFLDVNGYMGTFIWEKIRK